MNKRGVTIIELIVVTSIVSVLAVALGFSFMGWLGKYRAEKTVKDIYSDLMDARARAMTRNRIHFVDFPTAVSYRISDDDSNGIIKVPNGDGDLQLQADPLVVTPNTDTTLPTFPKTIENSIVVSGGTITWTGGIITLDSRGIVEVEIPSPPPPPPAVPEETICIFTDFDGDGTSDVDPDYDCIVISQTRINLGKLNSQAVGDCDANHCDTK